MVSTMVKPSDSLPTLEPYSQRPARRPWPIKWALLGTLTSAGLCLVALYFGTKALLGNPKLASAKSLSTTDLFNLLKLIFAFIAGIGGVIALVVAYRRQKVLEEQIRLSVRVQFHAEQVAAINAYDATERRVTDLYGQSVEKLGNDKAAVRLGGLYSLERLAQDYEQHRQAVIDVVCAYLRMPFQVTVKEVGLASTQEDTAERGSHEGPEQEFQVRLAAQRLLATHLRMRNQEDSGSSTRASTYWANMRIDLTGAHLIDLDFSNCSFSYVEFSNARFSEGRTRFENSHFTGDAIFSNAIFEVGANFAETHFGAGASFTGCKFGGEANYKDARFKNNAGFNRANFQKDAFFDGAVFAGTTWFRRSEFKRNADFRRATFGQRTAFDSATFDGDAHFAASIFPGKVTFQNVTFTRRALFIEVDFGGEVTFKQASFKLSPRFIAAKFHGTTIFIPVHFEKKPEFARAIAKTPNSMHEWPPNWKIDEQVPDGEMGRLINEAISPELSRANGTSQNVNANMQT